MSCILDLESSHIMHHRHLDRITGARVFLSNNPFARINCSRAVQWSDHRLGHEELDDRERMQKDTLMESM